MADLVVRSLALRLAKNDTRSCEFVASTDAVDSYGEIVEQSWDLARYSANPVVLYAHNSRELPIGRAEDVRVEDGQLVARIVFASAEANPIAEQVWQLVREGVLRAVSVGFFPKDVRWEKRDGQEVLVLSNNELLEISVVPIPANPEALARMRARALGAAPTTPPAPAPTAHEDTMDKELLKQLGLPETATAEDVRAAVAKRDAELAALRAATGRTSQDEAVGAIAAMRAAHEALPKVAAERDALVAKLEGIERKELIEGAIRAGKLAASDRDPSTERGAKLAALSLASLRTHVELAVPMLPAGEDPAPAVKGAGAEVTLTAEELHVAKKMGNDPAAVLASKKAQLSAERALATG